MRAAVGALRQSNPARIIVAVPVAADETVRAFGKRPTSVVCLSAPPDFHAVSMWYEDFSQTGDEEVRKLLESPSQKGAFDVGGGSWAKAGYFGFLLAGLTLRNSLSHL